MKLKMSKEVDLGKEPIGHLLFVLAVPSIISQVVNALYNMRKMGLEPTQAQCLQDP